MFGTHHRGRTLTSDVADDTPLHAVLGHLIGHARSLRLPRALTAFTDATLLRELVARVIRGRASPESAPLTSSPASTTRPRRWCGASPLARKHAAWRERRR